jgi:hypothetical protein
MSQHGIVHAVACAIALSMMYPAPATVAQEQLPAAVAADLKGIADVCREAGGKPITTSAVKSADLDGDGKADFVLDTGSVGCEGAESIYGDREKGVTVYVGDGAGGAVAAFSDMVFGVRIEGSGAAAKVWLTTSGAACGKPPAPEFASESFCERSLLWDAKARKFGYAPVSTVRMIE